MTFDFDPHAASCSYKWDSLPSAQRPERGLLAIRAGLNAFANLRPAIVPKQVGTAQCQKGTGTTSLMGRVAAR